MLPNFKGELSDVTFTAGRAAIKALTQYVRVMQYSRALATNGLRPLFRWWRPAQSIVYEASAARRLVGAGHFGKDPAEFCGREEACWLLAPVQERPPRLMAGSLGLSHFKRREADDERR